MERIKQALEKARQERQQAGPGAIASRKQHTTASVPVNITYTHTRTVDVSNEFLDDKRVIAGMDADVYTNAYKILRTQILKRLRDNSWNSLAVTSPRNDEGKTLTAINLAISLSMEVKHTVLLVDANLHHPGIHTYFGFEPEPGLSDYLTSDTSISDMLVHPEKIPGLVILPAGKAITNSSEMLNSPKMSRLVEEVKNRYHSRIIVFDLPPLITTSDALAFSPHVDAVLLVLEERKTQSQDAIRAVELLETTNLIGTVLNKSHVRTSSPKGSGQKWIGRLQTQAQRLGAKMMNLINRILKRDKQ